MPLALVLFASILFIVAVRGNYADAGKLTNETFFGSAGNPGFFSWFASILVIAIIFRVIRAPAAGEIFIALLLLVYFLRHNNALQTLDSVIQSQAGGNSSGGATNAPNTGNVAPGAGAGQ